MTEEDALLSLGFCDRYIDEINLINSMALINVARKDLVGLEDCLNCLKKWRKENDDLKFCKSNYQLAMEYFIKKFKRGVK